MTRKVSWWWGGGGGGLFDYSVNWPRFVKVQARFGQVIDLGLPQLHLATTVQLEFISNFQGIQAGVSNQFGYIKSGSSENTTTTITKQPPIARPISTTSTSMSLVFSQLSNSVMFGLAAVSSTNTSGVLVNKDVFSTTASSLYLYMSEYWDQREGFDIYNSYIIDIIDVESFPLVLIIVKMDIADNKMVFLLLFRSMFVKLVLK